MDKHYGFRALLSFSVQKQPSAGRVARADNLDRFAGGGVRSRQRAQGQYRAWFDTDLAMRARHGEMQ